MSAVAQAVVSYNPHRPSLEVTTRIVACEAALLMAPHPRDIANILDDLKLIEALIVELGDWGQHPRLLRVRSHGRSAMFRQCQAILHRCAELVDICDAHFCTYLRPLPAYEDMAEAVLACDDVAHFFVPTFKQFYWQDLRRRLVACMEDSASATPVSASETSSNASAVASETLSCDVSGGVHGAVADDDVGDDDDDVDDDDDDDGDDDDDDGDDRQSQIQFDFHLYDFSSGLADAKRVYWRTACTGFLFGRAAPTDTSDSASIASCNSFPTASTGSSLIDDGPSVPSAKRQRMSAAADDVEQSSPDASSPPPVLRPNVSRMPSSVCDCDHEDRRCGCDYSNCPCKENHTPLFPHRFHYISRRWLGRQKRNLQLQSSCCHHT